MMSPSHESLPGRILLAMSSLRLPRYLVPALIITLVCSACGGQTAGSKPPADAAPPADQAATGTPEPVFDPQAIQGKDPVPPMFDPAVTDASAAAAQVIPGPAGQGIYEAPGIARALVAVVGGDQPTPLKGDLPVRLHLESKGSTRGHELLASIRTPQAKSEGGFLYFTGSTGGGGGVAPVAGEYVKAEENADGSWHYGVVDPAPTPIGLLNLKDLLAGLPNLPADLPGSNHRGSVRWGAQQGWHRVHADRRRHASRWPPADPDRDRLRTDRGPASHRRRPS